LAVVYTTAYARDTGSDQHGGKAIALEIKGLQFEYPVFFMPVMPDEHLDIRSTGDQPVYVELEAQGGTVISNTGDTIRWRAPAKPGIYRMQIVTVDRTAATHLNVMVMVPAGEMRNGRLSNYKIGKYPARPFRNLDVYKKPAGFIEVNEADTDIEVSPRFKLGQFLCKQDGGFPKYLLLRPRLLVMLERIVEELNGRGGGVDTLHVMSGYRTPYYNAAIGNGRYSRHLWGGAADIFIDVNPRDGILDDMNDDGSIDRADAVVLLDIVQDTFNAQDMLEFKGGLAQYGATTTHGPFVHVDVRGYPARW